MAELADARALGARPSNRVRVRFPVAALFNGYSMSRLHSPVIGPWERDAHDAWQAFYVEWSMTPGLGGNGKDAPPSVSFQSATLNESLIMAQTPLADVIIIEQIDYGDVWDTDVDRFARKLPKQFRERKSGGGILPQFLGGNRGGYTVRKLMWRVICVDFAAGYDPSPKGRNVKPDRQITKEKSRKVKPKRRVTPAPKVTKVTKQRKQRKATKQRKQRKAPKKRNGGR
jgi:hypothetical protein